MGILDGIVAWIAEKAMAGLDLITSSVLGALGCNMDVFLQYFPAAETLYSVFVAIAIGLVLLNLAVVQKLCRRPRARSGRSGEACTPFRPVHPAHLLLR